MQYIEVESNLLESLKDKNLVVTLLNLERTPPLSLLVFALLSIDLISVVRSYHCSIHLFLVLDLYVISISFCVISLKIKMNVLATHFWPINSYSAGF